MSKTIQFNVDYAIGIFIGLASPVFAVVLGLEQFPVLRDLGDVANPAWNLVVTRAISLGAMINAGIFFVALRMNRDRISKGILWASIPSVIAVLYFQFFN